MESTIPLVAIVRKKFGDLSDRVKQREDSVLWTVTQQNRDDMAGEIARWIESFDTNTST
jgi:nucleoside-triphosphatase THEP1